MRNATQLADRNFGFYQCAVTVLGLEHADDIGMDGLEPGDFLVAVIDQNYIDFKGLGHFQVMVRVADHKGILGSDAGLLHELVSSLNF